MPAETVTKAKNPLSRYVRWLHTMWPAGTVEKLPEVRPDGSTNVPGLYVVGDLTGIPLLKFSSDTGARAVQTILADSSFQKGKSGALDLVIVGAGVSGMAAALEAKKSGLSFEILEASEPFSTIVNFPKGKPIFTYPTDMTPAGDLHFRREIHPKEVLVDEIRAQTRDIKPKMARAEKVVRKGGLFEVALVEQPSLTAQRVIVAIGRSGNFRKLGVPGEDSGKVFNRLHDPKEYAGKDVLVVGGGDSAIETAIAVAECGARATISYRKPEFSRPKPDNVDRLNKLIADPMADVQVENPVSERVTTAIGGYMGDHKKAGSIRLMLSSKVGAVRDHEVDVVDSAGKKQTLPNDAVFAMIGREPPLDFFRRSGVRINGEWRAATWIACIAFVLFCVFVYNWKSNHPAELPLQKIFSEHKLFPYNLPSIVDGIGGTIRTWANSEGNVLYTLKTSASAPPFYYTLGYCLCVLIFGIRRIRRRKTPYVKIQTLTLIFMQWIPLFILPEIILPWMGRNGMFSHGGGMQWLADHLFERYDTIGHERAYWRSYGFILAFPLNVYNVFTDHPMWLWLGISFVQTFVLIPAAIYFWGKGVYCGWMCSCGALAETMGDAHRHKMPHGPFWNRVNLVGQVALGFAFLIVLFRIAGWVMGDGSWPTHVYHALFEGIPFLNYSWSVDILLGGILGLGLYFWFSGRVWCRFACPLAALMHIYSRFSRFRILPEKKKCISCNVCTSVCHQGIDIMNFANKGLPMQDPECVRCSACVQMCPTGVLTFGQVDRKTGTILKKDPKWMAASPVQMAEASHSDAH
ncbi:MAG: NAD(P)-binding domain-containing protein [Planctomycetes bacterium]|nr:NAD(P)-binding domain-containing protein [Planctomycetota bacterium]MBI3845023.1 NAD(P)-binding domain-containing protein [Planctomycetota bacterium]